MKNKRDKIFEIFSELEDSGVDLPSYIRSNEALRKRVNRNFDNVHNLSKIDSALFLYGYVDLVNNSTDINYYDLLDCLYHSEEGISYSIDKVKNLVALTTVPEDVLISKVEKIIDSHKIEKVAEDIIESDFEKSFSQVIDGDRSIEVTVNNSYGSVLEFYKAFGIDERIIYANNSFSRFRYLVYLGKKLEGLVYKYIFPNQPYQVPYKDCVPDFIIDGEWLDVKLSKGTALDSRDSTLNKYLKYRDQIIILYLIDDGADVSFYEDNGYAKFIPISSYYEDLSKDIINIFEDFREEVELFKGAIDWAS